MEDGLRGAGLFVPCLAGWCAADAASFSASWTSQGRTLELYLHEAAPHSQDAADQKGKLLVGFADWPRAASDDRRDDWLRFAGLLGVRDGLQPIAGVLRKTGTPSNTWNSFLLSGAAMDFLLNELSHRSKNVFALVLSIINQTRADGIREFKSAISQRIIGLAASNDLLLGQIGLTTQLAELIDKQLEGFVAPTDPRIGIDVVPVALGANATRVLGMAIHELATNSCKYGALSSLTGRLTISCQVDPQDSDYLMIRWQERGGPILSPPTRSGFGRKVIEVMVSRALNADVQLCFDIEGVRWNCRIHTKNIYL